MYCHAIYNQQQQLEHLFWGSWLDFFNVEKAVIKHREKKGSITILEKRKDVPTPLSYVWGKFFLLNLFSFSDPVIEYLIVFHFVGSDDKGNTIDVKIEVNIPKKQYDHLKVGEKVAVKYIPNPKTGVVAIVLDMDEDYE